MENQNKKISDAEAKAKALELYKREIEPMVASLAQKLNEHNIDHMLLMNNVIHREDGDDFGVMTGQAEFSGRRSPLFKAFMVIMRSDDPIECLAAVAVAKSGTTIDADHSYSPDDRH